MNNPVDLLIVGGGPAGLCAAISGASEGLNTVLLDNGSSLGGQARESNAIENYPGFPDGVTGDNLMGCCVRQAQKFHTAFVAPTQAVKLFRNIHSDLLTIHTDDYNKYEAKAVIISIGLQYRRLHANGIGPLMGRGVYYGLPGHVINDETPRKIAIIGGANSAGQAAVKLAQNEKNEITMFIRTTIEDKMSQYLIDRIRALTNIKLCEHCEVVEVYGQQELEMIRVMNNYHEDKDTIDYPMDCMVIFIGGMPRTLWLEDTLRLSPDKYILTGPDLIEHNLKRSAGKATGGRLPFSYETSLSGVFAAGDVRSGSSKRVAVAAGEGAGALQMVHKYLSELNGK
jgi:thioredoxin reductase (NADPH)